MDQDGSCCSRSVGCKLRPLEYRALLRREVVRTRSEAAARARSDADYAFLSTAPSRTRCRRGEVMWTRTEAAARAQSDAD